MLSGGIFSKERNMAGDTKIGVTSNSWAGLEWKCADFMEKTLIITNTHDTNSLDYRCIVRAESDGVDAEEIASTSLAAKGNIRISLNNWLALTKLECKATTPNAQATYQIDYGGRKAGAGGGLGLHLITLP
jgi:hypothetical protein